MGIHLHSWYGWKFQPGIPVEPGCYFRPTRANALSHPARKNRRTQAACAIKPYKDEVTGASPSPRDEVHGSWGPKVLELGFLRCGPKLGIRCRARLPFPPNPRHRRRTQMQTRECQAAQPPPPPPPLLQGLKNQPVRSNRRGPVPVYRTGLAGNGSGIPDWFGRKPI